MKTIVRMLACVVWFAVAVQSYGAVTKQPWLVYKGNNAQMTVGWQLDVAQTNTIKWGLDTTYSAGSAQSTEVATDHRHLHTITGLTPGTKYYYQVVNVGTGSFKTGPAAGATSVKFFAWGDTRSNPTAQNQVTGQMVAKYGADAGFQTVAFHVGDWAVGDTAADWANDFFNQGKANSLEFFANVPQAGTRGNHEGAGTFLKKFFPFPYAADFYGSMDYGPAHVSFVDTETNLGAGSAQITWLENDLASTSKPWKIIVLHAPGWSASGHPNDTSVQNNVQPLCLTYGVKLVLSGHNHYYCRCKVDGVNHVTTGGGGASLYNPDPGFPNVLVVNKTYQHSEITIAGDTLTYVARNETGGQIDTFTITQGGGGNQPPAFTADPFSKADATVAVAYSKSIAGNASDPDGDPLVFNKNSGPAWLTVAGNGDLTGTPASGDLGVNTFVVEVQDTGGLSDTATMNVTVVSGGGGGGTTLTFESVAAEDGYVTESSESSEVGGTASATATGTNALRIGDTATKQQYRCISSFDTSSLPDAATILSATLRLKRGAVTANPSNLGAITADIKGGNGFNANVALEVIDFEGGSSPDVATMNYPTANDTWSEGAINAAGLLVINKTGKTQLRTRFVTDDNNDAVADYMGFYSSENAAGNRPQFVVVYQ